MDNEAINLDLVRDLLERANANTITDAADLERCIRGHDLVFGIWPEDGLSLGVGYSIIKGGGALERIKRAESEGLAITAVPCLNAEEAEAMRELYGDQPAQILPLRET